MTDYSRLPEHMRDGARLYVERGVPPGSFLTAVLENNFLEAFKRADETNTERMRDWASWIYSAAPTGCHGSREAVSAWIKSGGLSGLANAAE